MAHNHGSAGAGDLKSPIRNRYFYGKLLDVHHFKLEQDYFNDKRWLLNRGVAGFGVVCGLGVEWTEDRKHVVVHPGVAIDKCGREIIVVRKSEPLSVDLEGTDPGPVSRDECDEDDEWVHVSLCYHECESDPERALGGDCDTEAVCAPSSIRERYTIEVLPGRVRAYRPECSIPGVIEDGKIDFRALARYVSRRCRRVPENCCIPLANVRVNGPEQRNDTEGIDITIRPIVYTNDLLFELILACCDQEHHEDHGEKE
jgi:hypothetical protein